MIYEMVVRCIEDLRTLWTDLNAALTTLLGALPESEREVRNQLSNLRNRITVHIETIVNPDENGQGFVDIQALLANARDSLNDSLNLLIPNTGTTVLSALAGLLDTLLAAHAGDEPITAAVMASAERLNALRDLMTRCLREIEELTTEEGGRANLSGIRDSVENISTYPLLTQESGYAHAPPYPATGIPGTAPLGQIVESTLRDVLGWRPKTTDPKAFVAALTQSFTCKEMEGRSVCTYTPRTFAVQVQVGMGAITGAQASLYARAKAALDQSLILLDRLKALDPAADPQNVEADRAMVRSELTELVNELGVEGGPRVQRVDALFDLLRGPNNGPTDPLQVQGLLGQMRHDFGLTGDRVTLVEEEQNLSDFITLVDYVNSLRQSWNGRRPFFDRSGFVEPFLGTQLVHISRALAVIAESVREISFALDSVFLGGTERQTIELTFTRPGRPPIFVAEMLNWVERFASEEGPGLVRDAGKYGVRAFFPTIDRLIELVHDARIPPQDPRRLPAGYATARVQRALQELEAHLRETADLAGAFLPRDAIQSRVQRTLEEAAGRRS
jgi:hypothetical protein